jgi:hypothetical protein
MCGEGDAPPGGSEATRIRGETSTENTLFLFRGSLRAPSFHHHSLTAQPTPE